MHVWRVRDNIPRKVSLIDCRHVDVSGGDATNHQYYRLRSEVMDDVNHVLSGRAPNEIPNRDYIAEDRSFRVKPKRSRKKSYGRRTGSRRPVLSPKG